MTPTLPILYGILLQAVKDMAYRPGKTVNAFAVVDGVPDLTHPSFGYTADDYRAGRFWSRSWVGEGARSDKVVGQWPVIMPELVRSRRIGKGLIEHTVDITLVDTLAGESSCGRQCHRAGAEVYANLLDMGLAIIDEVLGYGLYENDYGLMWSTPARMATDVKWSQMDDLGVTVSDYVKLSDDIRPWGDYPHLRGLYMSLTLTECLTTEGVTFRYDQTDADAVGVVNCEGKCC